MMRTVKSNADLRRLALATGASVEIDGRPFNAGNIQMLVSSPRPKLVADASREPPAYVAEPAPAPAQTLTRAEVDQMLAAHNLRVTEQIASIIAALKQPQPSTPGAAVREWDFTVTYDSHHAITNVNAKARP